MVKRANGREELDDDIRDKDIREIPETPAWKAQVVKRINTGYTADERVRKTEKALALLAEVVRIAATEIDFIAISQLSAQLKQGIFDQIIQHLGDERAVAELADVIYDPVRAIRAKQTAAVRAQHKSAGSFNARPLHACSLQIWQTTEHLEPLLPFDTREGYVALAPYSKEAVDLFSEHLKGYLDDPETHTLSFPVGPGHWRLVTLKRNNGRFIVELFDSFGAKSAEGIKKMIEALLDKSGIASDQYEMVFVGPAKPQRDAFACGDFTVAWAHKVAKVAATRANFDIRLMSALPNLTPNGKNLTIITPDGLFQTEDGVKPFRPVLSAEELGEIIGDKYLADAEKILPNQHQSILAAPTDSLTHQQLFQLNKMVRSKEKGGHACSIYYPAMIETLDQHGNNNNALRNLMRSTSQLAARAGVRLESADESDSESDDASNSSDSESDTLIKPRGRATGPTAGAARSGGQGAARQNKGAGNAPTGKSAVPTFMSVSEKLIETIGLIEDQSIEEKARNVLKLTTALYKVTLTSVNDKKKLMSIILATDKLLKTSTPRDRKRELESYKKLAYEAQGRPSGKWKALGGVMMVLGIAVAACGCVLLATGGAAVVGAPLVALGAIIAFGVGLSFFRSTGLSREMHDLANLKSSEKPTPGKNN